MLLLSLLLGLYPCEKEENVGEVIPPADQGQSTVVCTKSRAKLVLEVVIDRMHWPYVSGTVRLYLPDEVGEWMLVQAAGGDRRDARRPFSRHPPACGQRRRTDPGLHPGAVGACMRTGLRRE